MANETLRQRQKGLPENGPVHAGETLVIEHPGGDVKHGGPKQLLRFLLFLTYFLSSCFS